MKMQRKILKRNKLCIFIDRYADYVNVIYEFTDGTSRKFVTDNEHANELLEELLEQGYRPRNTIMDWTGEHQP